MSAQVIRLRYPARCADCDADLDPGERVRYYPARARQPARFYGLSCHNSRGPKPLPVYSSRSDGPVRLP